MVSGIEIIEDGRNGRRLHKIPSQDCVLFQQAGDFIAARLPDRLGPQPCGADGVCFGKRSQTPLVEVLAGEAEGQRQNECQQAEQGPDQDTDAVCGRVTYRRLPAADPETGFMRRQLSQNKRAPKAKMFQAAILRSRSIARIQGKSDGSSGLMSIATLSGIGAGTTAVS